MVRVVKQCREADVALDRVAELGWSKVAVIAKHLTKENASELLAEVENKTFGQLQEMVRQKNRQETKSATQATQPLVQEELTQIIPSDTVYRAIEMAREQTGSLKGEDNLNFVAEKFMELFHKTSISSIEPSRN